MAILYAIHKSPSPCLLQKQHYTASHHSLNTARAIQPVNQCVLAKLCCTKIKLPTVNKLKKEKKIATAADYTNEET